MCCMCGMCNKKHQCQIKRTVHNEMSSTTYEIMNVFTIFCIDLLLGGFQTPCVWASGEPLSHCGSHNKDGRSHGQKHLSFHCHLWKNTAYPIASMGRMVYLLTFTTINQPFMQVNKPYMDGIIMETNMSKISGQLSVIYGIIPILNLSSIFVWEISSLKLRDDFPQLQE